MCGTWIGSTAATDAALTVEASCLCRASRDMQVKKQDVRQMMIDIDKLESPHVTFDEFVEMVTPRMQGRDTREEIMKVRGGRWWPRGPRCGDAVSKFKVVHLSLSVANLKPRPSGGACSLVSH